MRRFFLAVFLVVVCAAGAAADSYEDAVSAYDRGDYTRAAQLLRPLAEQGDARAQFHLGPMYAKGLGVPQNDQEAVKWYRKAADQGFAEAQFHLGLMYANGLGVSEHYAETGKWFRKAADQGFAEAQSNLGLMYAKGLLGVSEDFAEAVKWFRKAADQGFAEAQSNLGVMYFEGKGVSKDFAEAVKWFRKAADQGIAMGQYNLGRMYAKDAKGLGDPEDLIRALMWFNVAAAALSGDNGRNAKWSRDSLASRMTPAQIEKAQKMARRCQDTKFKDCD